MDLLITSLLSKALLLGTGGLISYGLLFFFAPHLLPIIATVVKSFIEALIEYIKILWAGLLDVVDDFRTVVFVLSLCLVAFVYGGHQTEGSSSKHSQDCLSNPSKKTYRPSKEESIFTHPLDWWRN